MNVILDSRLPEERGRSHETQMGGQWEAAMGW